MPVPRQDQRRCRDRTRFVRLSGESNRVIRLTWTSDWPRNQTIFATALVDYDCDGDCCDDSNSDDSGGGGNGGGADGDGGGGGGGSHDGCSGDSDDGGEIENRRRQEQWWKKERKREGVTHGRRSLENREMEEEKEQVRRVRE